MNVKAFIWTCIACFTALTLSLSACNKDDDDDDTTQNGPSNDPGNDPVSLPETYVVIDGDTFYESATSVQPDPNAYRQQVNFTPADQFNQQGNDGNIVATLAITTSFKDQPTQTGSAPFSATRFQGVGSDSVNFYVSFFLNTGHPEVGNNFLSPKGEALSYTIDNGTFSADLPPMSLINEADPSSSVMLNGGVFKLSW